MLIAGCLQEDISVVMSVEGSAYVLGDAREELDRLEAQAEIFRDPTEDILRKAGIGPGMRVLDIGCGVGDVAQIAAELVGPTGSVLAVDLSDAALATAQARLGANGLDWVTFMQADVNSLRLDEKVDAVIGRFILMHLPNPVETVRNGLANLVEGGAMAFVEMDISSANTAPEMALFDQCMAWIVDLYRRIGAEPDMGSRLYGTLRAAGLDPQLQGSCRVEAGPSARVPNYLAETIRAIMPSLDQLGIANDADVEIDTLGDRLREASLAGDQCFAFPRLVGAWVTTAP